MSIGNSGRIVLEVDADLKRQMYTALTHEGLTLKDWFIAQAQDFIEHHSQLNLQLAAEPPAQPYRARRKRLDLHNRS